MDKKVIEMKIDVLSKEHYMKFVEWMFKLLLKDELRADETNEVWLWRSVNEPYGSHFSTEELYDFWRDNINKNL